MQNSLFEQRLENLKRRAKVKTPPPARARPAETAPPNARSGTPSPRVFIFILHNFAPFGKKFEIAHDFYILRSTGNNAEVKYFYHSSLLCERRMRAISSTCFAMARSALSTAARSPRACSPSSFCQRPHGSGLRFRLSLQRSVSFSQTPLCTG